MCTKLINAFNKKNNDQESACILRIEKASMHDGTGLRNVIFFKGCPLRCIWCSTPESHRHNQEIGIDAHKCTGCGQCIKKCKINALRLDKNIAVVDKDICNACYDCIPECPNQAIKKFGEIVSIEELADELSKDEMFYHHSNGGVTLSGGEPCSQAKSAAKLLKELKSRGINTAIETSLFAPWDDISLILPYLDHMFVDIKHMCKKNHEQLTGVDNDLIINNLMKLGQSHYSVPITIRIPLIPGINDSHENLCYIAELSKKLTNNLKQIELLPYHRLGQGTYKLLNIPYLLENIVPPTWETMSKHASFLSSLEPGVPVVTGGQCF